jgi:hypothetical protein
MLHPFEAREISAWVESARLDRAQRILSDPRLRPTRVGSDDPRVRRQLSERFAAEAFDDLRMLAVATPSALWVDRAAPLGEREREALSSEDIAIVAGACSLPFLLAVPQCETAPSFRRMQTGRALIGICEAFGRVDVLQVSVAVQGAHHLAEGLRVAAAAALGVLGPIDQVTAFGVREGAITASVVGQRGLGTLAVGAGIDATSFSLIGEGGLATVATGLVAWRRRDGAWVEETHLAGDGDEPIIQTILEAEKPSSHGGAAGARDDGHRRMRLRIAALADTLRLSARTAQSESVEAMLRGFGVDPVELLLSNS